MLGFTKKQDFGIQVNMNAESRSTYDSETAKLSSYCKERPFTESGMREMGETGSTWKSKEKKKSTRK
jgi:hypothetical protein